MKKSRNIAVLTYCTKEQIQEVLIKHKDSLKGFAYIFHDKEHCEPHYHLLLCLVYTWSPQSIQLWFKDYACNTFPEIVGDLDTFKLYLTHSDLKSIEEGKYHYSQDKVVSAGIRFDDPHYAKDDSYSILGKIMEGYPLIHLVRLYGRDFVYHYRAYKDLAQDISDQESSASFRAKYIDPVKPEYQEIDTEKDVLPF